MFKVDFIITSELSDGNVIVKKYSTSDFKRIFKILDSYLTSRTVFDYVDGFSMYDSSEFLDVPFKFRRTYVLGYITDEIISSSRLGSVVKIRMRNKFYCD